jgi:hypothetical protein
MSERNKESLMVAYMTASVLLVDVFMYADGVKGAVLLALSILISAVVSVYLVYKQGIPLGTAFWAFCVLSGMKTIATVLTTYGTPTMDSLIVIVSEVVVRVTHTSIFSVLLLVMDKATTRAANSSESEKSAQGDE